MPPLPGTPAALPGNNAGAQCSQILNLPAGYVYSHRFLPGADSPTPDGYAQDSPHNTNFDPDMLTDEGTCTGWYTTCCVVMHLTSIVKTRAAYWVNVHIMTCIDRMEADCGMYYYLQLPDTGKYISRDIFRWIIKEQCSDQGESQWIR